MWFKSYQLYSWYDLNHIFIFICLFPINKINLIFKSIIYNRNCESKRSRISCHTGAKLIPDNLAPGTTRNTVEFTLTIGPANKSKQSNGNNTANESVKKQHRWTNHAQRAQQHITHRPILTFAPTRTGPLGSLRFSETRGTRSTTGCRNRSCHGIGAIESFAATENRSSGRPADVVPGDRWERRCLNSAGS